MHVPCAQWCAHTSCKCELRMRMWPSVLVIKIFDLAMLTLNLHMRNRISSSMVLLRMLAWFKGAQNWMITAGLSGEMKSLNSIKNLSKSMSRLLCQDDTVVCHVTRCAYSKVRLDRAPCMHVYCIECKHVCVSFMHAVCLVLLLHTTTFPNKNK